jgi:hypothetical protein
MLAAAVPLDTKPRHIDPEAKERMGRETDQAAI